MPEMSKIQLSFNTYKNRWVLSFHEIQPAGKYEDRSYSMEIEHAWDGEKWDNYKFFHHEYGEECRLVTRAEFDQRVKDIAEHEGEEAAQHWVCTQLEWFTVPDDHLVFQLRTRWEAMMALELFSPAVTL